ncbi:pre-mRNA-splicing factor cwc22 [Coemansia spiralis]|nr:pre-mRNA-splicing factor cwc22 [Coemansia spiralis]
MSHEVRSPPPPPEAASARSDRDSSSDGRSTGSAASGRSGGSRRRRRSPPVRKSPDRGPARAVAAAARAAASSGRYLPPALKRQLLAGTADGDGAAEARQRESWEQLKKRINGPVNKVNVGNIKDIVVELFGANLVRGRGLFCRSVMRAQSQSTSFTAVYAALVAVVNTKLPVVGELLVTRQTLQFRRAFKRDDKAQCIATAMFLAHLTNQRVAHEVLAFQVVSLLLETPTDDSVEVAVAFMREVGALLTEIAPRVLNAVFDTFRSILHEADIDKRVQYMIEVLFQYRRDGFKDSPIIPEGLDLVEEDEQIVHEVALDDDDLDAQDELNVFTFDAEFDENERKYDAIRNGILGGGGDDGSGSDDEASSGSESGTDGDAEDDQDSASDAGADGNNGGSGGGAAQPVAPQKIHDLTETELVNLRRTIYLSIMSSMSHEEAAHKLLKIELRPGEEQELCNMVIECCSQERTYKSFFGLIGERLCKVNRTWASGYAQAFASCYENIHKYETGHLRNISHFFAHLLGSDALPWSVLRVVVLTEETTTSSSRIFLKIVLQDLAENLGLKALNEKLKSDDPRMADAVRGLFPNNNAKSIRFAINYYTSIGLGAVTEEMREWLKTAPMATTGRRSGSSSSGSGSESSGSYSSGSDSRSSYSSRSGSASSSSYTSSSGSGSDSSSGTGASASKRSRSRSSRGRRHRPARSRSPPERSPKQRKREHSPPPPPAPVSAPAAEPLAREAPATDGAERRARVRSPSYSPPARSPRGEGRNGHGTRPGPPPFEAAASGGEVSSMRGLSLDERQQQGGQSPRRRHDSRRGYRRSRSRSRSASPRQRSSRARDDRRHQRSRGHEHGRHRSRSRSPRRDR